MRYMSHRVIQAICDQCYQLHLTRDLRQVDGEPTMQCPDCRGAAHPVPERHRRSAAYFRSKRPPANLSQPDRPMVVSPTSRTRRRRLARGAWRGDGLHRCSRCSCARRCGEGRVARCLRSPQVCALTCKPSGLVPSVKRDFEADGVTDCSFHEGAASNGRG